MAKTVRASFRQYLKETRRPVYSAALVLPFFLIYHIGTLVVGSTYINGADALIIRVLSALSVHSMFASALVLLGCFVVWQLRTRASWDISSNKLLFLYAESLGFALLLLVLFAYFPMLLSSEGARSPGGPEKFALYCGAGIYEELVFRGFLLGSLILISTRFLHMKRTQAAVVSAVTAAMLCSLFHYIRLLI